MKLLFTAIVLLNSVMALEVSHSAPRLTQHQVGNVSITGLAFDSHSHRVQVADQPAGPGTRFTSAQEAASACGGIAAINAGFFTPQGDSLGMVVSGKKVVGFWNKGSSLGSGAFYENDKGQLAIGRRGVQITATLAKSMRELLQSGPLLVEKSAQIGGLENAKVSARCAIAWDGGSRWWIGRSSPCTLTQFATILANQSPSGWEIVSALNLDGGLSADLYISDQVSQGPIECRNPFNRMVRNYLVVKTR